MHRARYIVVMGWLFCHACLAETVDAETVTTVTEEVTQNVDDTAGSAQEEVCGPLWEVREIRKRRFVPPQPVAPSHRKTRSFQYDRSLQLKVLVPVLNTSAEDGNERFLQSCLANGIDVTTAVPTFGTPGFRKFLIKLQKSVPEPDKVILMYLNNPADTIFAAESSEILRTFQDLVVPTEKTALLSSSRLCKFLCGRAFEYPAVMAGSKFADPYNLIGSLQNITELVAILPPPNEEIDAKLGITPFHHLVTMYASGNNSIGIDSKSKLFQNLYAYETDLVDEDFDLEFSYRGFNDTRLKNTFYNVYPSVIYGGGNSALINQVGNYIPLRWLPVDEENITEMKRIHKNPCWSSSGQFESSTKSITGFKKAPLVYILIYIEWAAPFLTYFLDAITVQNYPKDRMIVDIRVGQTLSSERYKLEIESWQNQTNSTKLYQKISVATYENITYAVNSSSIAARVAGADHFIVTSTLSYLNNTETIRHLVETNKTALTPVLPREGMLWSNVWGSNTGGPSAQCFDEDSDCLSYASMKYCTEGNFTEWMHLFCRASCRNCTVASNDVGDIGYKRSFDYHRFVEQESPQRGIWNVPIILDFVTLNTAGLSKLRSGFRSVNQGLGRRHNVTIDVKELQEYAAWELFLQVGIWIHERNGHTFASNVENFGFQIDPTGYNHKHLHPDLFLLEKNPTLWKKMYLSKDYKPVAVNTTVAPHCWDVYTFPLVNEAFCDHIIEDSERFGRWSGSSTYDDRLPGGYEAVPTQDIHFNQFGFDKTWRALLRTLVKPIVDAIFVGYNVRADRTLDFIVRYRPDAQSSLRPHQDSSSFSLTMTLNNHGIDFEGGGTHYVRQNCTVNGVKGYGTVHPGILTHQHEGLPTTSGTRYIIVSFVDQP